MTRASKNSLITALGSFAVVLVLVLFQVGTIYDYPEEFSIYELPEEDAIVCLAGARGRIEFAADLWLKYWKKDPQHVPKLLISGMGKRADWEVFSSQVKPEVLAVIHPENVILETVSENTRENAVWASKFVIRLGWTQIVLVTSSYHMKRSQILFAQEMPENVRVRSLSLKQAPYTELDWYGNFEGIRVSLIEYIKGLVASVRR